MTILEQDLEAKLVKAIRSMGGHCLKWTSPGTRGVPDRIILLPGGLVAFAEMKRPKGSRVDPLQKYWRHTLEKFCFPVYTVYTETDMRLLLQDLKKGMGES